MGQLVAQMLWVFSRYSQFPATDQKHRRQIDFLNGACDGFVPSGKKGTSRFNWLNYYFFFAGKTVFSISVAFKNRYITIVQVHLYKCFNEMSLDQ